MLLRAVQCTSVCNTVALKCCGNYLNISLACLSCLSANLNAPLLSISSASTWYRHNTYSAAAAAATKSAFAKYAGAEHKRTLHTLLRCGCGIMHLTGITSSSSSSMSNTPGLVRFYQCSHASSIHSSTSLPCHSDHTQSRSAEAHKHTVM
eukprot:8296-Heterococcus_DN1.PRE.3